MRLTSPTEVRALLEEIGVRPSRSMGQNFLIDANILAIIMDTADLRPEDRVLEIGAGLGVLTERLAARAASVTALEKDARLFSCLEKRLAGVPGLTLVCADVTETDLPALAPFAGLKVVANLPYSVSGRVLMTFAESDPAPDEVVAMLQRESAERLVSGPGDRRYGLLSVWTQLSYDAAIRKNVSASCFWPRPKVASAIVKLTRRPGCRLDPAARPLFRRLTRTAFMHRRKKLLTILAGFAASAETTPDRCREVFRQLGLDPGIRPEDLSADGWAGFVSALAHGALPGGEPQRGHIKRLRGTQT